MKGIVKNTTITPFFDVDPHYYLHEYDDILLGNRKTFSSAFMSKNNDERICMSVLKYVFKNYLHWSPVEVRDNLTEEIITRMKLLPLINRLPCPDELDRNKDLYYIAWALYPETINVSKKDLIIKVYDDVLSGVRQKFPKEYFDGNEGYVRARVLMVTMLREHCAGKFNGIEEMYQFFASQQGRKLLLKYKLHYPLRELYPSALHYFHDCLPLDQRRADLLERYEAGDDLSILDNEQVDEKDEADVTNDGVIQMQPDNETNSDEQILTSVFDGMNYDEKFEKMAALTDAVIHDIEKRGE